MLQEMIGFLRSRGKATLLLAAANVLVLVVLSFLGDTESGAFLLRFGADYAPLIMQGEYWRLFSSMFLHFGLVHLAFNMICLVAMGDMLEHAVGSWRYLLIYLAGGLAGNVVSMAWAVKTGDYAVCAGASGAIFAVIGGILVLALKNRRSLKRDGLRRIVMMVVLMAAEGFTQAGTDNAAHLGGLAAGMVLTFLLTLW